MTRAEAFDFDFGIPKPIAFDYRTARQLDPSKRTITGDVNSEKVRAAVAFLKSNREKAEAAGKALEADPLADVNENFGLAGSAANGDNILSNVQAKAGLEGVFAAPARKLRDAVKAINDIMDDRTRGDTERVGRMMISKWYSIVQDKNTKPLDGKDPSKRYLSESTRKSEVTQASLQQKIFNYVETIDFLLKWVE